MFFFSSREMADAGVGVFVWRMNNCGILALFYKGGKERGDWRFCVFSIQKFIAWRRRKRVLRRLLLPLTTWHARAVELRRVSVDPVSVTNRFLWWRSKVLFFLKVVREKRRCLALRLIFFAQARQSRQNATQIRSLGNGELQVVVAYHAHVITLAWEVDALQLPRLSTVQLQRSHHVDVPSEKDTIYSIVALSNKIGKHRFMPLPQPFDKPVSTAETKSSALFSYADAWPAVDSKPVYLSP